MNDVLTHDALADRPDRISAVRNLALPHAGMLARRDLIDGVSRWWLWLSMAMQDIRHRYRGSVLGPFWLTISMAVMILTLGVLYSTLFKMDIRDYLPFLCLGLLIWNFISISITDGCNSFVAAEAIIRQIRMPFTVHICRAICRNVIIFAHNAVVFLLVALYFDLPLTGYSLLAVPGFAVLIVNAFWISILLGMVCARFRDVAQIVNSIVQVVFFITPIIWKPDALQNRTWIADYNPLYAMIEIVRAPLLNQPVQSWLLVMVGLTTVIGCAGTYIFFRRFRHRIPYWI
jgi:ABC-2 type transport system permease protein/lipopolysaccharide transport system permease protein